MIFKMKINICILLVSLCASNLMAQSQVQYTAAPGQRAVYTTGGPVANGNSVWIGTFNQGFDPNTSENDPYTLLANWHQFGSTTITTLAGQPGRFTGNSSSSDPFFPSRKIYLWVFSTDNASAPEQDFANVNEYGLFSSTDGDWSFSPDPPPNNFRAINSTDVNQLLWGSADGSTLFLSGGFILVPEPSTFGLLSVALPAIVLALRKRRAGR
jgi:hypothetical protein